MDGVEVITNYGLSGLVNAAKIAWPDDRWPGWYRYTGKQGEKYASKDSMRLPTACRLLIERMAELHMPGDTFPDLDLHGAGMHWIRKGGSLPLHRDAKRHPLTGWTRRYNAILFLESCDGGELVFTDTGEVIKPEASKLVTFPVDSPHEVREVTGGERRTLSLFWWDDSTFSEDENTQAEWI